MNVLKITYKQNKYHRNFDTEIETLLKNKWNLIPYGNNASNNYRKGNDLTITRYYAHPLKESDTINDSSMRHMFKAVEDIEKCWNSMMWRKDSKQEVDPFEPWATWDGSEVGDTPRKLTDYISAEIIEINRIFYVL